MGRRQPRSNGVLKKGRVFFAAIAPAVLPPRIEGREQNAPATAGPRQRDVSLPRGCRLPRSALSCCAPPLDYRRPSLPRASPVCLGAAAAAQQQPGVGCPAPSPPAPRPRQKKR